MTEPAAGSPERPGDDWRETLDFDLDQDQLTPAQLRRLWELDGGPGLDPDDEDIPDPRYHGSDDDYDPPAGGPFCLPGRMLAGWLGADEPDAAGPIPAGFTHADRAAPGEGPGHGFGSGGVADSMLPGRMLAALTSDVFRDGMHRLTDDEVVGVALAARRNQSQQAAVELAAVSELSARRLQDAAETQDSRAAEQFGTEIAVAFTLTGRAASAELDLAAGLERLPEAAALLAAGVLDRDRT